MGQLELVRVNNGVIKIRFDPTVALLRHMTFSVKRLPVARVVVVDLLLVLRLIHQPSQQTLEIFLPGSTHAVVVMDFLSLHVHHEQRPMGVGEIHGEIELVKFEDVEFFGPSSNVLVGVSFVGNQQFFDEERIREPRLSSTVVG